MNWRHLQAFLWLRWRLAANQWRRGGTVNKVLMMIISVGAVLTAIPIFIGSFVAGVYFIPNAQPVHLMYAWDVLVVAFLFFWGIGLITELQRSEPLALSKFLHLPVSVNGAFLINYISSLLRLSLIVFAPAMLGYALSLAYVEGISQIAVLPLLGAFLLMVTALTYQLQGWLAALMSNPRRRRTVIVCVTGAFILLAQLPNLINFLGPWSPHKQMKRGAILIEESTKQNASFEAQRASLLAQMNARKIKPAEYSQKLADSIQKQQQFIENQRLDSQKTMRENFEQAHRMARIVNGALPIGWLPFGAMSAAEGRAIPSLLGLLGMASIGVISLWRSYRSTIGLYQGQPTNRKARLEAAGTRSITPVKTYGSPFLETHLAGLSDPVSAVALASLRSLVRSPEAKMMLLTPVIMIPIFGSMIVQRRHDIPEAFRPLVAIGAMVVVLFGLMQLMGNLFGMDRDGFRVFVLSPAPRWEILLGKNLAFVPIALLMALTLLILLQILCPMRIDHFLAMFPQYVSMYLMFCIMANFMSIYAPFHIAAGSLKPSNPKMTIVLLQLLMFMVLFPLTQATMIVPLGIEALLHYLGWNASMPVYLILSVAVCVTALVLYRISLTGQGILLQANEQRILECVTNKAP